MGSCSARYGQIGIFVEDKAAFCGFNTGQRENWCEEKHLREEHY